MSTYTIICKCCEEKEIKVYKKPTKKTSFICGVCLEYCKHIDVKTESSINKFKKISDNTYFNEYTKYTIIKHNNKFYEVIDSENMSVWDFPKYTHAVIAANDTFLNSI